MTTTPTPSSPVPSGDDPIRLDDLVALVTGAGGGIGRAVAQLLAARGAVIAAADRPESEPWPEPSRPSGQAHSRHDLEATEEGAAVRLVGEVIATHGRLDLLICCAGINSRSAAAETTPEEWERVIAVNLTGTYRVIQASYPALRESPAAAVVTLTSTAAAVAVAQNTAYSTSKAGLGHLTRQLASEWATDGIRLNAVGPTIVATNMTAAVREDRAYMADKLASIPLGRMASVEDVAHAVAFLASPAAGMVTGQTMFVDGGVTTR